LHCYTSFSFVPRNWDDDVESLMYFNTLHACFNLL
jgi:hypothetical protein